MKKQFFTLLLLALAAYGQQQKRIAIVNTEDDGEPPIRNSELTHLTDRLREIANKTLPKKNYAVMTQQSIVDFLGSQESMIKECREAESCLAKLGRKINADYIGQARIGRFGKDLTIKVELYESGSGNLINSFTEMSKDIYGLLSVLNENAPTLFKQMPNASDDGSSAAPTQPVAVDYRQTWMAESPAETDWEKSEEDTYAEQKEYAKSPEKSYADAETSASGTYFYLSFYKSTVTSFYEYKNQELRKKNLDVIFGGDAVFDDFYSIGLFFGGGSLWDKTVSIGEIIAGADAKKIFWLWPERIAIPISLGLAWRMQMTSIGNRVVAEFIDEPKFQEEPGDFLDGRRDLVKHNFDIMPSVDLQIFVYRFSLYAGYMYRATLSGNWGFEYKMSDKYYEAGETGEHFDVPDKYDPLKNSKEQVFGIPGTLRFGIKYKYE